MSRLLVTLILILCSCTPSYEGVYVDYYYSDVDSVSQIFCNRGLLWVEFLNEGTKRVRHIDYGRTVIDSFKYGFVTRTHIPSLPDSKVIVCCRGRTVHIFKNYGQSSN